MRRADNLAGRSADQPGYRPDIDGLRAVAVIPVLLYHANVPFFSGGYVGVDVFFVISGFVITLSLLRDIATNRFSIGRFYERRARRILPALIATIGVSGVAVLLLFYPPATQDFFLTTAATATFTSNIYLWLTSNYFAVEAQVRPLLHTWSLSVEEQFYIIVPLVFFLIARYGRSRWIFLFGAALIASFALSVVATNKAATFNFYMLPTRAWELLLGVCLAFSAPALRNRALAELVGLSGLVAIAISVVAYTDHTAFPGFAALLPCLGATAVIYAGINTTTVTTRLLSLPPLLFIGRISYSLYLVHWPLIVVMKNVNLGVLTVADTAMVMAASFILATISYYLIEQPFRRPGHVGSRKVIFAGSAAALAVLIGVSVVGVKTGGFAARYPGFDVTERVTDGGAEWKAGSCFLLSVKSLPDWDAETCSFGRGDKRALLWGDSHAAQYIPGLEASHQHIDARVSVYTMAACPPFFSDFRRRSAGCAAFNSAVGDLIRAHNIDIVILAARWISHPTTDVDLAATIGVLKDMGVEVIVIGQSPIFAFNPYDIDYRLSEGRSTSQSWPNVVDSGFNIRLRDRVSGAAFIVPEHGLCASGHCLLKAEGQILYLDNAHFSRAGSALAVARYFPFTAGATPR